MHWYSRIEYGAACCDHTEQKYKMSPKLSNAAVGWLAKLVNMRLWN